MCTLPLTDLDFLKYWCPCSWDVPHQWCTVFATSDIVAKGAEQSGEGAS